MDLKNLLIIVLVGLLAWKLAAAGESPQGGGGDANRNVIAVTGTFGSGASALYLFDTRTRHLAVYRVQSGGRKLELIGARDCMYDFYLETFNDATPAELLPHALKKGWQSLNNKAGLKQDAPESEESRRAAGTLSGKKSDKNR